MNNSRLFGMVLFAVAWSASSAHAEMTLNNAIAFYDQSNPTGRQEIERTFTTLESGFGWANAELTVTRKENALFCSPPKMAFTGSQLIDISRRAIENDAVLGTQPWGLAVLMALKKTFPCPP